MCISLYQSVSVSVCLFPKPSETAEPTQLKLLGEIRPWIACS